MLPQSVLDYLQQAAKESGTKLPAVDESLFLAGVLDSFSLVDFVSVLEQECGVTIPDAELRPENFDSINKVESFLSKKARA